MFAGANGVSLRGTQTTSPRFLYFVLFISLSTYKICKSYALEILLSWWVITSNVAQAAQGIAEVNENVAQSSSVSGEIAGEIAEVSGVASQISKNSNNVNGQSGDLSKLAGQLSDLVNQFRV